MIFAEELKRIMETDNLTKADVVKKTGVSFPTLGRYLSGERSPRVKDAAYILKSLGYSLDLTKNNPGGRSKNQDIRKNGSGYYDPTAYKAIKKADSDRERMMKLLNTIFIICDYAGFHIEERIVLKDKKTGRIWKRFQNF